jgi:hypothetical protein
MSKQLVIYLAACTPSGYTRMQLAVVYGVSVCFPCLFVQCMLALAAAACVYASATQVSDYFLF